MSSDKWLKETKEDVEHIKHHHTKLVDSSTHYLVFSGRIKSHILF